MVQHRLNRRFRFLFSVGIVISLCSGCNRTESSKPRGDLPKSKGTIGLSVLTLTNPFFKIIGDNFTAEAARHGYDAIVVSGDFDVAKQQNQVKDFIAKHVAAIVLCPCDSKSIGPAIQEANAADIPVFTCDIKCLSPDAKVVSHIATDNYQGGKLAADAMIEVLDDAGGKIAILDHRPAESCLQRVKGFKEVIEAHNASGKGGRIEIVAELPSEGTTERGYKAAEDCLQSHGDLVGIFAINDLSGLGARAAIEKAGKADQIKIIAFDGQTEGRQAIKEGKIYADPIQFPDQIGVKTMQTIAAYFDGDKVPPEILMPTSLYRKADGLKDPTLR
jgi:ribose transport system substrate-binding protein